MALHADYGKRTIHEMVLLYRNNHINLDPGFQRKSVWSIGDRRRLIQSIVSEYPLPNIFLYRRSSQGKPVYDVIDGKQRLETILMFMGIKKFKKEQFDVKLDLDNDGFDWWDWADIKRHAENVRDSFENSPLQTVVEGDVGSENNTGN